jgi:hypothetical protein
VFCLATGRQARLDTDTRAYFDISDRPDLDYGQKLDRYRKLADAHFAVDEYRGWLSHLLRGGSLPAGCGMGGLTWPERQSKAPPGRGRGLC